VGTAQEVSQKPSLAAFLDALNGAVGDPYVYGAAGPGSFDCSGLVQWAAGKAGVLGMPRTSETQYAWSNFKPASLSSLQPGDLIFTQWPGDDASPGHVAVYVGQGQIIEAPRPGRDVQRVALDDSYRSHVVGVRRYPSWDLAGAQAPAAGGSSTSSGSWFDALTAPLADAAKEFAAVSSFFGLLAMPSTWVRVGAGVAGLAAIVAGIVFLLREARASDG
jgi:hypothetical protein